ncbi:N-acetylmuramoyl-L-alanine amidase [Streptomyces massasporeus]|uniref:peptidoglycan recognition protein family protein n=1 Tax=Streptomyces massasporeus TaxID=67324 RepID=UPI0036FE496D
MATPLNADRLVAALKAEGCTVHEVPGWRTHNRNHKGAWGPVHGVQIHHTVTGPGTDVVGLIYNGHSALPGPLATGCITKDGVVHLTGNGRANHAGGGDGRVLQAVIDESYGDRPPATQKHDGSPGAVDGNARFYGWECENKGDGKDPWPAVQYDAMVRATAAICRAHGWGPKSGIGHLEWSDWKVDPRGIDMKDFRADVAERLAHEPDWNPGKGEDPMAGMTKQDIYDAVWKTDQVAAPDSAPDRKTNASWQPQSYLKDIGNRVRSLTVTVAAQSAAIHALAEKVGSGVDTNTVVAAVERAIADAVIKVDIDVTQNQES